MKLVVLFLILCGMLVARAEVPLNSLDRVLAATQKSPEWSGARSQAERLGVLRKQALKYAAVSDLVSDRYLITALAGPVDLVRFFGLARSVCGGSIDRRAALLKEWRREGATRLKIAAGAAAPVDLSPDDLPSNALGALFGEELKPHNANLGHDLIADLQKFLGNLDPVVDSVTTRFTYEQLVHGLSAEATPEARRASREWLTAEPLYLLPLVAPEKAKTFANAAIALKAAGLEVRKHEGHPIVIERIGTPEPVAKVPEPKFPKAVPVDEPYPKAVPVPEKFPKAIPVK
ncbi:MAG: hypothetical protein U0984_16710 [Prosthecobacter sp.]|nr:hypothetical protein [Prosthecobacter sp.]